MKKVKLCYESLLVEIIEIKLEAGYAASGIEDGGISGGDLIIGGEA